nr:hypothetical protein [Ktedonobacteraceae bacterium]
MGLQMGKNPGTIDASDYFIVLEGARCPNASGFNESIPKTGKSSSNTRSGRNRLHIKEVKNPRLIETGYRSPQLTLWTLGPDEWLLFLKLPDYAARKKPQRKPDVIQLPLLIPMQTSASFVSS